MRSLIFILVLIILGIPLKILGQHEGHSQHNAVEDSVKTTNLTNQSHKVAESEDPSKEVGMSHSFSRNLPMNRNGSGTGWLPDASPMYGYMYHSSKWMFMLHGNIFIRYNNQDITKQGSRGGNKVDAPNWFMGMGQTKIGNRGLFRFSAMLSLDPLTVGGAGYPLLFQSGETWEGRPLVDKQHPHDFLSELSIGYSHMLNRDIDIFAYLGYPGEPAFGPVAFMHRVSSLYNPDAPLGHHWQDATHITFGVATAGIRFKNFKLEGSSFTGREPDEHRYGFDEPKFDSWSTRFSYNPSPEWALQVSRAWIKSPERYFPDEDVVKTSISAIHSKRIGTKTFLNSAVIWGLNNSGDGHKENSILAESAFTLFSTTVYGKYEWVEKSAEELDLNREEHGHSAIFNVNAFTLGFNQNLFKLFKTHMSVGLQGTVYGVDKRLTSLYGNNPLALETYLRIYPGLMSSGYKGN